MGYDQCWHTRFETDSSVAAAKILRYVVEIFSPESCLDLGAGAGNWTKCAMSLGITDFRAVDGPWTDVSQLRVDRDYFLSHDLSQGLDLNRKFDLAISLEAAQYMSPEGGVTLVRTATDHANVILFSSAVPFQGGNNVTERWQSYWSQLFEDRGFQSFDLIRPRFWRDRSIAYYYRQNTLIYVNTNDAKALKAASLARSEQFNATVLDLIHPEKWEMLIAGSRREKMKRLYRKIYGVAKSWVQ